MGIPVLREDGVTHGDGALPADLAAHEIKPHLVHETVVAELAARRRGTASTRNRAQVRGGGAKPWRQKGTGRARQGSIRSPQWTGGGVVFGPTPRDHDKKVNRKVRLQAFRSALRAHADRGSVALMDPTGWDAPSTKRAAAYLFQAPEALDVRPLLVVVEDDDGIDACSFRNLAGVHVLQVEQVETVDLMAVRAVLVARAAWERLSGGPTEVSPVDAKAKPKRKVQKPPEPKPLPVREEAPVAEVEEEEAQVDEEPTSEAPEAEAAVTEEPATEEPTTEEAVAEPEPAEAPAEPEAEVVEPEPAEASPPPRPRRSRAKAKAEPEAAEPEADADETPDDETKA